MSDTPANPPQPNLPPEPPIKRLTVDIPANTPVVYANLAFISNSLGEIVLDFAQVLPRMPKGNVVARVIMSPMHAKMLQLALGQNVANYERQFGEIQLPQQPSIADRFFRFPRDDEQDKP